MKLRIILTAWTMSTRTGYRTGKNRRCISTRFIIRHTQKSIVTTAGGQNRRQLQARMRKMRMLPMKWTREIRYGKTRNSPYYNTSMRGAYALLGLAWLIIFVGLYLFLNHKIIPLAHTEAPTTTISH